MGKIKIKGLEPEEKEKSSETTGETQIEELKTKENSKDQTTQVKDKES